ncbi:MAG: hypothetical protein AB1899_06205 [Pseudomonadota bacterium]
MDPLFPPHSDCHGQTLKVGDEVRILRLDIDPDMDEEDQEMFEFMLGAVCAIDRFDADGLAWVSMWWITGDGNATTSVGLTAEQMEKVVPAV